MLDFASTFRKVVPVLACAFGCSLAPQASAIQSPLVGYEDIDLFVTTPVAADIPNILFILDTSANWSSGTGSPSCATYADGTPGPSITQEVDKKVGIEKCALVNALLGIDTSNGAKFNVAFMFMNASNANGAYPRQTFIPVTAANKTILVNLIKNTSATSAADQGSNADIARSLWEGYLWFTGKPPLYGRAQTNPSKIQWDTAAFAANGNYISPVGVSCSKNYIIFIANGSPQGTEADIQPLVVAAGGNGTMITYTSGWVANADQNNWADETARFLHTVDVSGAQGTQPLNIYTIMVDTPTPNASQLRTEHYIAEIGNQGGGGSILASDVGSLTNAINGILNQIQAGNSVFASASLPVSVNSQGTFLNQVFMGMFRPDSDGKPRWVGNLKQYQFAYNAGSQQVTLVDSVNVPAINAATGFISPNAVSFWTAQSTSADFYTNFWSAKNWPNEVNAGGASDSPDGQLVEKGGAAEHLRAVFMLTQSARKVYTCIGSACSTAALDLTTAAQSFSTGNAALTQGLVAAGDATERDNIINWARGTDKSPTDDSRPATVILQPPAPAASSVVTPTVRPSIHGDVLHSSPAVIDYGGSTGVVVYYGANDGMLHAVQGKKTIPGGGDELWSFVPNEFLGKFKRLRDNSPAIQYATTDMNLVPTPIRKDYGMDGAITFYQAGTPGNTTKAIIFVGMRRGGRALYAFDVTTPASPKLLWRKTNADISLMGQTWSEARVTRIAGYANPVLVMGGGYDPIEDTATPTPTSMGNTVIVLDAFDGTVLKTFAATARPVAAPLALVDMDADGKMDRAYAVDLGGAIYRVAFPSADPTTWTITKIADFSGSTDAGQKMFYAPSVTVTDQLIAIQVGTGDREKPLQRTGTVNRFFTVFDKGQTSAVAIGDLEQMTSAGLATLDPAKYGCYFNLPNAGEKVVNGVVYVGGYAAFGTNGPAAADNQCASNLGVARAYSIQAVCGPTTSSTMVGGGFPPTPVVGSVLIGDHGEDCEAHPELCRTVPIAIGDITPHDCAGNALSPSALGSTTIFGCPPAQRLRRGWSITNPR